MQRLKHPIRSIREPFGKAGLTVAILALATQGVDGDFYIKTGASPEIFGPKAAGAWGAGTALKGANGINGNTILNGTTAPGAGTGANGDFYIDTTAVAICGPKTAGAWGSGTSLKGTTGFTSTLPSTKTETGSWTIDEELGTYAISFPIPLASELPNEGSNTIYVPKGGPIPGECENTEHAGTAGPNNPEADPGFLCVYASSGSVEGDFLVIYKPGKGTGLPEVGGGASATGAVLLAPAPVTKGP